mmetsp:Transcript_30617/g.71202  ORF Transcript_30617/g.71202 Transcript_30617/m.71202 type:complete len:331 (+) Transcript_30617:1443-2435(+)
MTSMSSSMSTLRSVLALPTSKSLVMAMLFTTTKYCCKNAQNLRLPMPPESMRRQTSLACSGCSSRPSTEAKCEQKVSSEMLPSGPASCSKRPSTVPSFFRSSSRRAAATWPYLASTIAWHLPRRLSRSDLALTITEPVLASSLPISFLASSRGPLLFFASLATCSLMQALAAAAASSTSFRRASASSSSEAGWAKASTAEASREFKGFAFSSSCLEHSSRAFIFSPASAEMALACFLSRASMCAFFSACSFLTYSLFATCAFFFKVSKDASSPETADLALLISARASVAAGVLPPALANSPSLAFRKPRACMMLLVPSSRSLSISAVKAV